MRGVAAAAGVAPSVMRKYYANKEQMFAAAMRLPFDPSRSVPELLAPGLDGMGERIVRGTFDVLKDEDARQQIIDLFQAGASAGKAAQSLRDFLEEVGGRPGSSHGRHPRRTDARGADLKPPHRTGGDALRDQARAAGIGPEDQVVRIYAPMIQDLLDPTKPVKGLKSSSSSSSSSSD